MSDPPTGTVTFLFTDIEGSTKLWEQFPEAMQTALARHDAILRTAVESHKGYVVKMRGDGIHAAFANANVALAATLAAQRAMFAEGWNETGPLRVRAALHTGVVEERDGDYFGPPVNRAARLMSAGHGGQILLSLATQELVRENLPHAVSLRALGKHRLKDLIEPEHIFQVLVPDLPADFPSLNTLDARPNNLPLQLTPLIGRETQVKAGQDVLRSSVRLLTLTGVGGTGKTRLAMQLAADLLDDFPDGVFWVNLAPVRDSDLIASTVAQALGVRESGAESIDNRLKSYLRDKQLLLLLDNFEQIIPAASFVVALLTSCPRLKILVTSREALRIRGEQEFPVPPLDVPDLKQSPAMLHISPCAAIELFVQRASALKHDFALTDSNAHAIAEICVRLDGLPLAIELAAARCKVLSPQMILERLSSRLTLLTTGARDLPTRHQTLRDTIAWSFDLLDANEKTLFARLGVFVGGCTLEAAEAVCGAEIFAGIESLVNKSLIRLEETAPNELRVTMLETIREFAREQLKASDDLPQAQRHHAEFYSSWIEKVEPGMIGADQAAVFNRLALEHDNLRAVFHWASECGENVLGLKLAESLWLYWEIRGHLTEGRGWLEKFLELTVSDHASDLKDIRSRALHAVGALMRAMGDLDQAHEVYAQALALKREMGDPKGIASALNNLGLVAQERSDYAGAQVFFEESLALRRALGDQHSEKRGIALVLNNVAFSAQCQGDYARARAALEESLAMFRELGDQRGISIVLNNLGETARDLGNYARALQFHEESLTLKQVLGHKQGIAYSLHNIGEVAGLEGDYARADKLIAEAMALFREIGHKLGIAITLNTEGEMALLQGDGARANASYRAGLIASNDVGDKRTMASCLEGLANVACVQNQFMRAAHLLGIAAQLRESLKMPLAPMDHAFLGQTVSRAQTQLGDSTFATEFAAGRALTLEQAIAYALEATA